MFTIEAIMSTDVITVSPTANLAEARTLMHDNGIHHVPVMDGEKLIGLITLTNVLAATDSFLRDESNRIHANEVLVEDAMVRDVATVDIRASLRQAALFLEKHKIGCLPVMNVDELVGIITDTDFVAVAINLLELLEETEPDDDLDDLDDLDLDEDVA
jgi:CBS-domain-containing membrane protein